MGKLDNPNFFTWRHPAVAVRLTSLMHGKGRRFGLLPPGSVRAVVGGSTVLLPCRLEATISTPDGFWFA